MHKSRFAGIIIDCKSNDPKGLDEATRFWSAALGMSAQEREGDIYDRLDASARDLMIEVQRVQHESRVHLDIETDDIPAEVARLEALGARRLQQIQTWWVMEAPTGQRFCVVRAKNGLADADGANTWR